MYTISTQFKCSYKNRDKTRARHPSPLPENCNSNNTIQKPPT